MNTVCLVMKPFASVKFTEDDVVTLIECQKILTGQGAIHLEGRRWQPGRDRWEQVEEYHKVDAARAATLEYSMSRNELEYFQQVALASMDHPDEWFVEHGQTLTNFFLDLIGVMDMTTPKPRHFGPDGKPI